MTRTEVLAIAAAVSLASLAIVILAASRIRARPAVARPVAVAAIGLYAATVVMTTPHWAVTDAAVLIGATGAVVMLERGLATRASVLVFLIVATLVDVISMAAGPSRAILESYRDGRSTLVLMLSVAAPLAGRLSPIVGIGDLVVGGAAAVALLRLGARGSIVAAGLAGGITAALLWGIWRGHGVPAIPFIAVALALARSPNRQSSLRANRAAADHPGLDDDLDVARPRPERDEIERGRDPRP